MFEEDQIQKELRVRGNEVEELKGKMKVVELQLEDETDKVKELEGEMVRLVGVEEEVQQHSRVYSSADRHHTNNFVQVVLNDVLAYFKGVMEKVAERSVDFFMKRMCLWSDGCAAQFKNRFQMSKLVELVTKDTQSWSRDRRT